MKTFIKKNYLYFLSFLLGLSIICILYIINKVSPFGSKSLLTVDFFHQYGPMLGEYYDRVKNGSNLIYSFNTGLGLPIYRNFLNYLASPFNFIILLFKKEHLLTAYSIIIALKCASASTTMTYYLKNKFKTNNLVILALSILYAYQAYFSAYYWNIMWIDGLVFLPIIIYGIENIINNNKWMLYTFTLTIMLLTNYFIGYMICLYSAIYFIFYLIYKSKIKKGSIKKDIIEIFKKAMTFTKASLLSGALAAFMLIPLFTNISTISATHDNVPTSNYYQFEFADFIKGHISAVNTTVFASDTITNPNVSCGIIIISLVILYILNYKIPIKNKICYLSLLLIIALCFFIPQMDFIMHAFHVPNDLPYRYSFLYSFTLIIISAYSLYNLKYLKHLFVSIIYVIILILLFILIFDNWEDINKNIIYINMILLTLVFVFYSYLYFYKNMYIWFGILFILVAGVDATVSVNRNWNIQHNLKSFYYDYNEIKDTLNNIKDEDKFYRIEKTSILTFNDPAWYNYHGVNTFSSMAYENMAKLQNKLGMPGNDINSYYYVHQTPIYDLMFNIKYFMGSKNDSKRYDMISTNLNKFVYYLPLGYAVNNNIKNWEYKDNDPFKNQNSFIENATNVYNVLSEIKIEDKYLIDKTDDYTIVKYTITNPNDNMYFYTKSSNIDFFIIGNCLYYKNDDYNNYINNLDVSYTTIDSYEEENIININSNEEEIELIVSYKNYISDSFYLYKINHELFIKAYEELSKYPYEITSFKENNIKGTITISDDMTLYTSIPYDAGWKVYVDNKEVKINKLADSLITINLKKGTHKINFVYHIPNILIGSIISLIAILYIIFERIIIKKKNSTST